MPIGYKVPDNIKARIIKMWRDTNLRYKDIANALNVSYDTVATVIGRYKKMLRGQS